MGTCFSQCASFPVGYKFIFPSQKKVKGIRKFQNLLCLLICIAFSVSTFVLSTHVHWEVDDVHTSAHGESGSTCTLCELGTNTGKFVLASSAGLECPKFNAFLERIPEPNYLTKQASFPFYSRAPPPAVS